MSGTVTPSGTLTYTHDDSIALPQSAAEKRFAIRMSDWQRIQRYVTTCKSEKDPSLSGWYFLCFGISGSAILSAVPLSVATGLPAWIVAAYLSIGIATTVIAALLVWLSKLLHQKKTDRLDELQKEMSEIESGFSSHNP